MTRRICDTFNLRRLFTTTVFMAVFMIANAWIVAGSAHATDVVIEPGHGTAGVSDGAYNALYDLHESDINLAIGLKVSSLLQQAGYQVLITRSGNVVMSEPAIDNLINTSGAGACISIHCNADGGTAVGTETYYSTNAPKNPADTRDRTLAERVQAGEVAAIQAYPYATSDRGVKTANFYIRNYTPPSVLTEVLFIDNNAEAQLLGNASFQWAVASGIKNAIVSFITPSDSPSPPPTNPPSTKAAQMFPLLYDYGNGNSRLWTVGRCDEASPTVWPVEAWAGGLGGFDPKRCQVAAGDFDSDTNGDVAVLYDYGGSTSALWLFLNNQGNGKMTPVMVWQSALGGFDSSRAKLVAGNFNGVGGDDVAILYDYGNATSRLWTFTSGGVTTTPVMAWYGSGFDASRVKLVAGNFNGAGADDIAMLYDYGNATSRLWTFTSNGTTMTPALAWYGPGFDASRVKMTAGNFNGVGADDVAMLYDYGNSTSRIWTFLSNGATMTPELAWYGASFDASRAKIASGDFGGDAKSDVALLYDYGNAATRIWIGVSNGATLTMSQAWYSGTCRFDAKQTKVEGESSAAGNTVTVLRPLMSSLLAGHEVGSSVTLSWSAITGATSYDVEILNALPSAFEAESTTASSQRIAVATSATASLTYDTTALTGGRTFYYRVIAKTGAGYITGYSAPDSFAIAGEPAANRSYPLLYDYGGGTSKLWAMLSSGGTTPQFTPNVAWSGATGGFDAKRCQVTTGDYDGDGTGDVAILYDYGGATVGIWLFLDNQGNGKLSPVLAWSSGTGGWDPSRTKISSGDFNGDGKTDIAMLYDYGSDGAGLWSMISNGTTLSPSNGGNRAWYSGVGAWDASRTKLVCGDFNGDSRSDVYLLYDDGGSTTSIWSMTSNGTTFSPIKVWTSGIGGWDANRTKIVSGNFGGDAKYDVALLYDYGNATSKIWSMISNGSQISPVLSWASGPGFDASRVKMTSGNFGGDATSDIALLYDYGNATTRIWTAVSDATAMTLNLAWSSGAGSFDANQARAEADPYAGIAFAPFSFTANGAYQVRDTSNNILASLTSGQTVTVSYQYGNYYVRASNGQAASVGLPVRITPVGATIVQALSIPTYQQYRGVLEVRYSPVSNKQWIINELDLNSYLNGMGEEPEVWPGGAGEPGGTAAQYQEFLKLSALAFRSYAYDVVVKKDKHPAEAFDLCNDPGSCQWYIGYARETQGGNLAAAISATNGQVVTYHGVAARVPYFSDCDGTSKTGLYPWCIGVSDMDVCAGHTLRGHGYGICMNGARWRASRGSGYSAIMHYYLAVDAGFGSIGNPAVRVGVYSVAP